MWAYYTVFDRLKDPFRPLDRPNKEDVFKGRKR